MSKEIEDRGNQDALYNLDDFPMYEKGEEPFLEEDEVDTQIFANNTPVDSSPSLNEVYSFNKGSKEMVILPPVRPERITKFLKPYLLKMHFTNKFVSAQVFDTRTATVACSASSQEKVLREAWNGANESTRDVAAAAAKIGKILGERLLLKDIPAVSVFCKTVQKYHGKVKAVVDSVREAGVKLL